MAIAAWLLLMAIYRPWSTAVFLPQLPNVGRRARINEV